MSNKPNKTADTGIEDRRRWKDIIAACAANNCFSILGLSDLDQPLKLADAIDHQAIFLEAGVTIDHRIAWTVLNPAAYKMTEVAETVLLNRGLVNGRLFTDEFEARRWLAGQSTIRNGARRPRLVLIRGASPLLPFHRLEELLIRLRILQLV